MRQDVRDEWKGIDLGGNPRVLVGRRSAHRRLDALRVRLHRDVFGELAGLCEPAVAKLRNYRERPFEPFAALDHEEYFWYEHSALPGHAPPSVDEESAPTPEDDTADLVRLVKHVDGLQEATRDDLDEGGFSFYAICWPHRGSMIGFVSRANPVAALKPGIRYFQYGDTLTTVSRPDLAFKEGADLVVGSDGTAILSPYSFETLLGDVDVSSDQVRSDAAAAERLLAGSIALSPAAVDALLGEASRTRANARRLRSLLDRLKAITLDAGSLRSSLERHGVDPGLLLDQDGQFSFRRESVPVFFDVIEGRYFEDDLSGERRRADRYSRR